MTHKGRLARDHLVGNAAERVEVDAMVQRCIGGRLFGGHVLRCSNRYSPFRHRRGGGLPTRSDQSLCAFTNPRRPGGFRGCESFGAARPAATTPSTTRVPTTL